MKSAIKRGEGRRSRSSELGTKGKRLRRGHLCPPPPSSSPSGTSTEAEEELVQTKVSGPEGQQQLR